MAEKQQQVQIINAWCCYGDISLIAAQLLYLQYNC